MKAPPPDTKNIAETYPAITLGILVGILVVFLSLFVYYFLRRNEDRDAIRYTIIADIQALIVTVFTAFITVATGVSAKLAEAEFAIAGFAASITGPFVLWLVARRILTPDAERLSSLFHTSTTYDEQIGRSEQALGWQDYSSWKSSLGPFASSLSGAGELQFINDMLPRLYYHGSETNSHPSAHRISTAFVYPRTGPSFKIQSIKGTYAGSGERPQVFLPGTASAPGGKVSSAYLLSNGESVKEVGVCRNGEWKLVPYEKFDICVISIYFDDEADLGDYIAIDPGKYMADHDTVGNGIDIDVAVISDRPLETPRSWDMSVSIAGGRKPAPLIFRPTKHTWMEGSDARTALSSAIESWIPRLVSQTDTDEDLPELAALRSLLEPIRGSLEGFANSLKQNDTDTGEQTFAYFCKRPKQRQVLINVLEWKNSVVAYDEATDSAPRRRSASTKASGTRNGSAKKRERDTG